MPDTTTAELTDHEYDGIQEYDNPLPGWWSLLFFLSFVFAIGYGVHYHLGGEGPSVQDEYDAQAAEVFELRFAELGELQPDRTTLLAYMNDPKWLSVGQAVYKANCTSCHGADAQGDIGPNLTDDQWKNVTAIEDIARVIADGAGNGSMPAWRNRLSHVNQIVLTAAYIASLRGSSPADPRAPEGGAIPAWNAAEGHGE
jgi:cytochrome c oxidase cbb3-type subunit 3